MSSKILGGENSPAGRYPYFAALFADGSVMPICGGTLITPSLVVTAAGCQVDGSILKVALGCTDISDIVSDGHPTKSRLKESGNRCEIIDVNETFIHPGYVPSEDFIPINDLALLKLAHPSSVKPISAVAGDMTLLNSELSLTVMGYGAFVPEGDGTTELQYSSLMSTSVSSCLVAYGRYFGAEAIDSVKSDLLSSVFCAGAIQRDVCDGDFGGPAVYSCPDDSGPDTLIGAFSYQLGCGLRLYPSMFAAVYNERSISFLQDRANSIGEAINLVLAQRDLCPQHGSQAPSVPEALFPPTPFPLFPFQWLCDARYYGTLDGCDCGCGAPDPDCDVDLPHQELYNCDQGDVCVEGACMIPGNGTSGVPAVTPYPTHSKPPDGWICPVGFYGVFDGCDCGCGAPDPDCDIYPPQPIFNCGGNEKCFKGLCLTGPGGNPFTSQPTMSISDGVTLPIDQFMLLGMNWLELFVVIFSVAVIGLSFIVMVFVRTQRKKLRKPSRTFSEEIKSLKTVDVVQVKPTVARKQELAPPLPPRPPMFIYHPDIKHLRREETENTLSLKGSSDDISFVGTRLPPPGLWGRLSTFKRSLFSKQSSNFSTNPRS